MAIFGPKPLLEKCQFFDFLDFLFLQRRKAFFRSRISKNRFSWPILPKKKMEKWPFLDQNPFEKMSIFRLFRLLVFIGQKGVFSFYNIIKEIFLAYIALKKKVGKITIFGPKPWVNPFGKLSIFRFFGLLVFLAQKGVFSSRIS